LIGAWRAFLSRTPRNSERREDQSLIDFFLERLGFGFFSLAAGLIYAAVILVALYLLNIHTPTELFLKSFMAIFAVVGFLLGSGVTPIIMSTVYGLMYLWGVLLGVMGYQVPTFLDTDLFPKKSECLWLVALGFVSVVLFLVLQ
jgi:hypothetical protein